MLIDTGGLWINPQYIIAVEDAGEAARLLGLRTRFWTSKPFGPQDSCGAFESELEPREFVARMERRGKERSCGTSEAGPPVPRPSSPWAWLCEFCFRVIAEGPLPSSWELVWQSAVCPECQKRVAERGGYAVVPGGAFAQGPDPRENNYMARFLDLRAQAPAEPRLTLALSRDGDSWCALLGTNLQEGTAGFGATRGEALRALAQALEGESA